MLTRRSGLRLGATVVVMVTSVHSTGFALPPDKACSLLTPAEISAQMGAPGDGREAELPIGRASAGKEPPKMCTWVVGRGSLQASFIHGANDRAARQAFRAQVQSSIDKLKGLGWAVDQKTFGENTMCWVATPPSSGAGPHTSGCVGVTGDLGVSVGTNGATTVEMDKVKKLLDAAMSRVH